MEQHQVGLERSWGSDIQSSQVLDKSPNVWDGMFFALSWRVAIMQMCMQHVHVCSICIWTRYKPIIKLRSSISVASQIMYRSPGWLCVNANTGHHIQAGKLAHSQTCPLHACADKTPLLSITIQWSTQANMPTHMLKRHLQLQKVSDNIVKDRCIGHQQNWMQSRHCSTDL